MSSKRTRRKRRRRQTILLILSMGALLVLVMIGMMRAAQLSKKGELGSGLFSGMFPTKKVGKLEVTEMYLTPNKYSRPQIKLRKIRGVVVHYTANPGASAEGNRNYFENLKESKETYASSHFIIGLNGEVVQCIPLNEIAYASNERNSDTISIECCHPGRNGKFNQKTYDSLVKLTAWLCGRYNLKKRNIIRHYDVTGKMCPKYYVEHEDKWNQFKNDVFQYIQDNT